jgi:hypothetical protein
MIHVRYFGTYIYCKNRRQRNKNGNYNSNLQARDLNPEPRAYKASALATTPQLSTRAYHSISLTSVGYCNFTSIQNSRQRPAATLISGVKKHFCSQQTKNLTSMKRQSYVVAHESVHLQETTDVNSITEHFIRGLLTLAMPKSSHVQLIIHTHNSLSVHNSTVSTVSTLQNEQSVSFEIS